MNFKVFSLSDIIPKLFGSEFDQEAAFVKKWTSATLSKEQFDSYKDGSTLRQDFVSNKNITDIYYGYGIPSGMSACDVMVAVLNQLEAKGVVFDLEDEQQKPMFDKLVHSAQLFLTQDRWPSVPNAYKTSEVLNEAVQEVRRKMNLSPVEHALI